MTRSPAPRIVYVPGLKPKPPEELHRRELVRCLSEGVRRVDEDIAVDVADAFQLVSWTYDFYGEHRDINLDLDDIQSLLAKNGPSDDDIKTVTSWRRRLLVSLFRTADLLPFLIPHFATEEIEIHLRDFNRYLKNENGIAEAARLKVRETIIEAAEAGHPVLLLGHSMGSVIAYEAMWQLSRETKTDLQIDLFLTTGSPLGQTVVQRNLMGSQLSGEDRYPSNFRKWINVAALGELTAIDRHLANDYSNMVEYGLLDKIDDRETLNFYHMNGTLNVHAEYGYLVNQVTAGVICEWWREKTRT